MALRFPPAGEGGGAEAEEGPEDRSRFGGRGGGTYWRHREVGFRRVEVELDWDASASLPSSTA